jgi:hypothetical protein
VYGQLTLPLKHLFSRHVVLIQLRWPAAPWQLKCVPLGGTTLTKIPNDGRSASRGTVLFVACGALVLGLLAITFAILSGEPAVARVIMGFLGLVLVGSSARFLLQSTGAT